jgi:putative two-component system response regulator
MRKTIFAVDDCATNLLTVEGMLNENYRVVPLSSAKQMFDVFEDLTPDLILLDIEMPEMDGFAAMTKLKEEGFLEETPVIFLTAISDPEMEAHGFDLGAADFILKPISKPVLLNRIKNHLHINDTIRQRTAQLEERTAQLEERTEQLSKLQCGTVHAFADLVEGRDKSTSGHIDRTTRLLEILINGMVEREVYFDEMQDWCLDSAVSASRLHDVGKISISDFILNKPGPLTQEEFEVMKAHPIEGERIIDKAINRSGDDEEFLQHAKLFAAHHHERWDGAGYPYGLQGDDIPLHGRLMALVDVYDALISERPYKRPFTHEEAMSIITQESGRHFDPQIAKVFAEITEQIKAAT